MDLAASARNVRGASPKILSRTTGRRHAKGAAGPGVDDPGGLTVIEFVTLDGSCSLFLHPLLLGTDKRLFRAMDRPRQLRLVDCTPTTTGVLMLSYDAA